MDAFAPVGGSRIEQKPKPLFGFSHAIVSAKVSVRGDLVALLFVSLLSYVSSWQRDRVFLALSRYFFSAKSFSWSVHVLGIVLHLLFTLNRILLLLWVALRTTGRPLVK